MRLGVLVLIVLAACSTTGPASYAEYDDRFSVGMPCDGKTMADHIAGTQLYPPEAIADGARTLCINRCNQQNQQYVGMDCSTRGDTWTCYCKDKASKEDAVSDDCVCKQWDYYNGERICVFGSAACP